MASITRQHFESELVRSQPLLRSAARGLCARQPNAEDTAHEILQDTNLRALESRDQFHGGSVPCWLYALTRNLFRDYLRKRGRIHKREVSHADLPRVADRDGSGEDGSLTYDAYPDADDPHGKLEATQVVEAIGRMSEHTASALVQAGVIMREWQQMPVEHLASFFAAWDGAGDFVEGKPRSGEYDKRQTAREWLKNQGLSKASTGEAFGAVVDEDEERSDGQTETTH
ncbi:DNA-directed RNA polymerase specialized sigma24 family protein [Bradyrhizobium sp. USDA 4011]